MHILTILLVFMVGASIGSFVNVLVSRSVVGEGFVRGRSHCDSCRRTLAWYDMIPIISYVVYRGHARCCGAKLSIAHPVVEGLFGLLLVWWLMVGFLFFQLASSPWSVIQPVFWLGIGILLLILAVADAMYGLILMPFVYIAAAWIYLYRLSLTLVGTYQWIDLGLTLVSGMLSFGFLWLLRVLTRGRGMGDGDPYLAFVTGSLLVGINAVYGMWLAFVLGAIWGVALLLLKKKRLGQTIPFGPFIIAGATLALVLNRFGYWL